MRANCVRRILLLALVLCLPALPARACNIPVFRYALEHWPADPYEVLVVHRGPLSPDDRATLEILGQDLEASPTTVNVRLDVVDLAKLSRTTVGELFPSGVPSSLPWMIVRYPASSSVEAEVWSGPLSRLNVKLLRDSPARREIARRILSGDSAVWLLLESGDGAQDDAAAALLQAQLKRLAGDLRLPEVMPAADLIRASPPLNLAFSVLRIGRTDSAEQMLVKMLLGSESDLAARSDPMVFPVFGQGRILYGLIGPGINENTIEETVAYLVAACSCEVKKQNPGVDLLMSADWGTVAGTEQAATPQPVPVAGEPVPIPRASTRPEPLLEGATVGLPSWPSRRILLMGVAAAGLLVIVTGTAAFRSRP